MRLPLVAAVAALALGMTACTGDSDDPAPTPAPTPSDAPTETPDADAPQSSADLVLAPGALLPVEVGMSRAEAEATGFFEFDVEIAEGCTVPMQWKEAFAGADVLASEDGTIVSLGATQEDGPRTEDGLGVGSRFGELIETYGGDLSAPEVAGFDQVGVFVQDGDRWLGFLFGDASTIEQVDNDPATEVTFAEATLSEKPQLIRDGC